MKQLITILALGLALCQSASARWAVAHLTPDNISSQRLVFLITTQSMTNAVEFCITVSGRTNAPLPETYSATVQISGQDQKMEHAEPVTRNGITSTTYRFTVLRPALGQATFFFRIPPRPEDPMPAYGHKDGFYYHIDLAPFSQPKENPNQAPEDTARKLADPQR